MCLSASCSSICEKRTIVTVQDAFDQVSGRVFKNLYKLTIKLIYNNPIGICDVKKKASTHLLLLRVLVKDSIKCVAHILESAIRLHRQQSSFVFRYTLSVWRIENKNTFI